ncbi:MAG: hypothetical protein GY725_13995 [bacterium]|nr:hypothetical protein [bacterium]
MSEDLSIPSLRSQVTPAPRVRSAPLLARASPSVVSGSEVDISAEARERHTLDGAPADSSNPISEILEKGLLSYIREQQLARLREEVLREMGISEADLAEMAPKERAKVEAEIQERMAEKLRERAEAEAEEKRLKEEQAVSA